MFRTPSDVPSVSQNICVEKPISQLSQTTKKSLGMENKTKISSKRNTIFYTDLPKSQGIAIHVTRAMHLLTSVAI